MKFMMLVCVEEAVELSSEERTRISPDAQAWVEDLDFKGQRLKGQELEPPGRARTVRVRNGQALVVDGPFAETKEQIAGFDILDCEDIEQALQLAARHPVARFGAIEVRAFAHE